jgi:hypothetical protein
MSVKAEVTLSDAVAKMVESQVAAGRYADFSSAIQDAAWNYFVGAPSIFQEYGITPEEVERSGKIDDQKIKEAKARGELKPWV